jgi:hypothetical protein
MAKVRKDAILARAKNILKQAESTSAVDKDGIDYSCLATEVMIDMNKPLDLAAYATIACHDLFNFDEDVIVRVDSQVYELFDTAIWVAMDDYRKRIIETLIKHGYINSEQSDDMDNLLLCAH